MNAMNELQRCAIVGHGSWATALVKVLTTNGQPVTWYVRNPEVLESLQTEGRNCRYLSDVELDMHGVSLSDDLNATIGQADLVFLVVPAAYLKSYLEGMTVSLNDKYVVSAIKGMVPDEYCLVTDYLKKRYGLADDHLAFICGPTHAEEVSHGRITYLTVACEDLDCAKAIGVKLQTHFIHLNYTKEVHILEFLSVLKNIYAVLAGIAVGMGYGDNFIAVLTSNCASEMYHFVKDLPCQLTEIPSSLLGDLLVSCYSSHSRNRQLGMLIGRGNTVKTALNEMTMVAEGYFASMAIPKLTEEQRNKLPIADKVYQILHQGLPVRKAMNDLEDKLNT